MGTSFLTHYYINMASLTQRMLTFQPTVQAVHKSDNKTVFDKLSEVSVADDHQKDCEVDSEAPSEKNDPKTALSAHMAVSQESTNLTKKVPAEPKTSRGPSYVLQSGRAQKRKTLLQRAKIWKYIS